jgi:catechol 2,3-dioxygenase
VRDDDSMSRRIDERVEIGHVHLKVSDLERSIAFYAGVLGFRIQQRWGAAAAFLGAGERYNQIILNALDGAGTEPAGRSGALYQFAIRYPDRPSLGDALRRLQAASVPIDGATDLGVGEAIYVRDPDGHGVELYRERPKHEWPRAADGSPQIISAPLDLERLAQEAEAATGADEEVPTLSEATRQQLKDLRAKLLDLHKVLLDDARHAYEMDRGRVGNNAQLLQLVISDPWFSWLHQLSGLIVRIDESIARDAPSTEADAAAILDEAGRLLTASEGGNEFQKRYYEALQRQPAVVLAHGDVRRALKSTHRS